MSKNLPKIAFLLGSTSSQGGIERVVSILANQLTEKGWAQVYVIGFQPNENEIVYHWNSKITFFNLLTKIGSMQTGIFKAIPRLRKFVKHNNIDVLVACGHIFTPLAGLSTFGTKSKMVYWSHSCFKGEHVHAYKKFNEHIGALFANTVIPLTKVDEQNYSKKTLAKKVVQIYNPFDDKLFEHTVPYNPNTKRIISVGRLSDQKKFDSHLLEVAKVVLNNNPEYTWHIYGKGELEDTIRTNIDKMGLNERVILEGSVTNLYDLYPHHSMMVMTSAFEGFPMSLLEGMAKKLPMVSFDVQTGPNEIIQDNKNGFLIAPFDFAEMARKIQELINDPKMRIEFSKANETMINQFKMETVIKQWKILIADLTNK